MTCPYFRKGGFASKDYCEATKPNESVDLNRWRDFCKDDCKSCPHYQRKLRDR